MNKWEFLAKLKLFKNILLSYISLWAYLMIIFMYFKIEVANIYMILFFIVCVVLTIIDWVWIFPKEQEVIWKRNPAYEELEKRK